MKNWFKQFIRYFALLSACFMFAQLFSYVTSDESYPMTAKIWAGHIIILIIGAIAATFILKPKEKEKSSE